MNISEAARHSGLPAKTIRYYEQIALIKPARRASNGYRDYDTGSLAELRFVHRSREVGFTVEECRALLEIYRDPSRESGHVKGLVLEKCEEIDARIQRLEHMREVLLQLARRCRGDEGPDCAILDQLVMEGAGDE